LTGCLLSSFINESLLNGFSIRVGGDGGLFGIFGGLESGLKGDNFSIVFGDGGSELGVGSNLLVIFTLGGVHEAFSSIKSSLKTTKNSVLGIGGSK
jgi:hypothetical protein